MGRRPILWIGLVLAIGWGGRTALADPAETPAPMPALADSDERLLLKDAFNPSGPDDALPEPTPLAPPDDLPPDFDAVPNDDPDDDTPPVATEAADGRRDDNAPRDPEVTRVQEGGDEENPLPPARETPPGQTPPAAPLRDDATTSARVVPADRLPMGRAATGLTVEVQSPEVVNLHQVTTLKIVVGNPGVTDAIGVVVHDLLPEGLEYVESQPEAQRDGQLLVWELGNLPAREDRTLLVRVKPTLAVPFEHAATVSMRTGSRSRTRVLEPKLKVELSASNPKVLRGQETRFVIAVSNTGTGPARDVVLEAKLSAGIRHEEGDHIRLPLREIGIAQIEAGQRIVLTESPLIAEAVLDGPQTCEVVASSPDVSRAPDEARAVVEVTVVEPRLQVALEGPSHRYTDRLADYRVQVENPGTASARNVRIWVTLPDGCRLVAKPASAQYDSAGRRLLWVIPEIDSQSRRTLEFQLRMGGIGFYQVTAEARAEGGLYDKAVAQTEVTGIADVDLDISEELRVIDLGEMTDFVIRLKNYGTKEARNLQVNALYSENLKPVMTFGTDQDAEFHPQTREVLFPRIGRLAPGGDLVLTIRFEAIGPGAAGCKVGLAHDDLGEGLTLEKSAVTRVTGQAPPR